MKNKGRRVLQSPSEAKLIAPGSGLLFSGLHPGLSLASGNTKAAPTIDTSIQFIIFLS